MQSSITDQLIIFRTCENHEDYEEDMDQVQVDSDVQRDSALASIMESLAITDFKVFSMEGESE